MQFCVSSNFFSHLLMNRILRNRTVLIYFLTLLISCSSTARLYGTDDKSRIYSGTLDDFTYNSVKQLLTAQTALPLKDTIIIKYDYNIGSCWALLDQKDDNYIQGFITRHKERVQTLLATRPNISVFDFKEPGNNLNKIKKWDTSIIVDSSRQLMKLVFKERSTCGNSMIVLPDRRFVFIRSDSHSEALDLPQDKILAYLLRN